MAAKVCWVGMVCPNRAASALLPATNIPKLIGTWPPMCAGASRPMGLVSRSLKARIPGGSNSSTVPLVNVRAARLEPSQIVALRMVSWTHAVPPRVTASISPSHTSRPNRACAVGRSIPKEASPSLTKPRSDTAGRCQAKTPSVMVMVCGAGTLSSSEATAACTVSVCGLGALDRSDAGMTPRCPAYRATALVADEERLRTRPPKPHSPDMVNWFDKAPRIR